MQINKQNRLSNETVSAEVTNVEWCDANRCNGSFSTPD